MKESKELFSAEEYLEDSARALPRARALISSYDYVGAIEAAQHSIELSVKALYLLVGEEPPKEHHAGAEFLKKVVDRLNFSSTTEHLKAEIGRAMLISRMYEWAHTVSVYGFKGLSASSLIDKKDAEIALQYADEVYSTCNLVVDKVRQREIAIRQTTQKIDIF